MTRTLTYRIDAASSGLSLEQYLKRIGCSRNVLSRLKSFPDGLSVNGVPVFASCLLSEGDQISLTLPPDRSSEQIQPVPMDLDVVYEDQDLMVINKGPDMPVHPSQGNHGNTLANGIAWHFFQKGEPFVFRAVSRLDRDTTGLLILAKHMLSASLLSSMVEKRQVRREYLALVRGLLPEQGTVDAPIARAEGSVIRRTVDREKGESARTHYRRLLYRPDLDLSLASLRLETGRTHQIRVHMAYIGHPLPGDFLYCPDYSLITRQALHSHALTFSHPITKKELHFEAPLPDDMKFIYPV